MKQYAETKCSGSLEGRQSPLPHSVLLKHPELRHVGSNTSPHSDLYVTAQLWAESKPLTTVVQTPYKSFKQARTWNEWLELPFSIAILPLSSQLAITVWDVSPVGGPDAQDHAVPFGGTTISLFDDDRTLHKGRQKCRLHRHKPADGLHATSTPAMPKPPRGRPNRNAPPPPPRSKEELELERLETLFKKHDMAEIPRVDWLDQLVFEKVRKKRQEVELLDDLAKRRLHGRKKEAGEVTGGGNVNTDGDTRNTLSEDGASEYLTLTVDFPRFDFPIVFTDHEYPPTPVSSLPYHPSSLNSVSLKPPPEVHLGPGIRGPDYGDGEDLDDVPPLIRIYDPEVGAKDNPAESKHRRLVRNHRSGVLDRDLKPNAKFRDELNAIMSYGPTQELTADEKDLIWKFRHHLTRDKRALTKFVKSVTWSDPVEARGAVQILPKWTEIDVDDALELLGPTFDSPAVRAYAVDRLRKADDDELLLYLLQLVQALKFEKVSLEKTENTGLESTLASFLIFRATQNFMLGNYLHWYLMVECDDQSPEQLKENHKLFAKVEYDFMTQLVQVPGGVDRRKQLRRQGELITILSKISKDIRYSRDDRPRKIEKLKKYLADPKNEIASIDPPLPLPIDPSVSIVGCYPEESMVFKSSLFPLLIYFKTTTGQKYPIIFKTGDDLRQDQLVIQIISLMDRLLRKENLDLKLSPYRILATGATAGAVQFVSSLSLAAIQTKYKGGILAYLRANNPDDKADLGVRKEAMDAYIKSCAGYCVITYILGVGDRHLDNLLLAPDGHFFHADFGYILGHDPKPFPPPIKLNSFMVDGMGGPQHENYNQFKQFCYTSYTILRKHAPLMLNLFSLMIDANIPAIRAEPERVVEKVRERFWLHLTEEEAIRGFGGLIEDARGAVWGGILEWGHGFVMRMKN
ncbi:Phosphatidylinositol (PI) 3-kinase [Agyrium rufum]|nr:Phosphatidylinositol (PI) 3-kinase [Agyrium rufum]